MMRGLCGLCSGDNCSIPGQVHSHMAQCECNLLMTWLTAGNDRSDIISTVIMCLSC